MIASLAAPERRTPPLSELCLGLARLALTGFGGVAPQARHFFVDQTRWLDDDEFADLLTLGQTLPGANIVNVVTILADRWYGPLGVACALGAFLLPPLVLAALLATLLRTIPASPRIASIEASVLFASAGLIAANGLRILAAGGLGAPLLLGSGVAIAVALFGAWMPAITLAALALGYLAHMRQGEK